MIEVSLRWQDRILSVNGFGGRAKITVGDNRADVVVPGAGGVHELIETGTVTKLRLAAGMEAEVGSHGDFRPVSAGEIFLRKDQSARIRLAGNPVSLDVRHAPPSPKAPAAPVLDLSSSETAGVILAGILALALALALPSRPAAVNEDEVKVTRARFLFEPVHEVIEAVEEPAAPAAAPAPVSRAKPSAGRKAPPARGDLLSTFASKGVSEALNKNLGSGTELTHIAGQASGHSGEAEEAGGPGLKSTGSGAEGQTYTIAGGGRSGRTGYSHAGGLAPRGRAEIQIAGSDGAFSGGMDREGIRRVIREHLPEIRNCYERELQSQPDLYGKVVLEWDIEAGGRVGKAAVKTDSLSNPKVGQCLTAHLRNWNFPEPPANTVGRVSYPFVFSAQ